MNRRGQGPPGNVRPPVDEAGGRWDGGAAGGGSSASTLPRPADTAYERLLDRLEAVRRTGDRAMAQCPAHDDGRPSLSVRAIEGQTLVWCFAGCTAEDVLAALGLGLADLYDEPRGATYRYDNGRTVHRSPGKRFRQSGNTNSPAQLYRLAKIEQVVAEGTTVYVTEGEKDCHALEALGAVATTAPMGATNWSKVDPSPLYGGRIVVIPDRDDPGRRWARDVLASLDGRCQSVTVMQAKVGNDPADHVAAGYGLDDFEPAAVDPDAEFERQADHARRVAAKLDELRVLDDARRELDRERRGEVPPFDAGLLDAVLARPAEPPMLVDGFLPSGGRLLVVAQRKTGKTTLDLNLGKSLLDGGHFLGRFATRPIAGNVGMLNYEISAAMLAGWAQQVGIPGDRLLLVNLRGRRNPLDHPDDRARLVELLRAHNVETLIVDPFGRAYTGRSQNDAGEVTAWLCELDRFAVDAGVAEVVLSVHAGWDGERTRGSSALEDWADVVATLARDPDDETVRYLRAFGRDVEVDEDRLVYEPDTRTLTLAGAGSRKRSKAARAVEAAKPAVRAFIADNPHCSGEEIRKGVPGGNVAVDAARRFLVEQGEVTEGTRTGRGGGKEYTAVDKPDIPGTPPTPPQPRRGEVGTPPTPSYRGGVPKGEVLGEPRQPPLTLVAPVCADCGWRLDSIAHETTCETA